MKASWEAGVTSMHSLPLRTTGHDLRHSCRHFLGLHLSLLTIATLFDSSVSKQTMYRPCAIHTGSIYLPWRFLRRARGACGRRAVGSITDESDSK
ncbi:hypothetical protein GGR55DRAFT_6066 [Xylaria sp. FL0064]|nr:hypothetical protein GGR55DRAFT_6066 [Xylaria sp. FL0064]